MKFHLSVLLITALLVTACSDSSSNKPRPAESAHLVETQLVQYQDLAASRTLPGTLQAIREVNISNQIQGILTELNVYPNDHVSQGQTLARLDDTLTRAELKKAQAALNQATIDLRRLKNLAPRKLASESDIAQAQTQKDIAASELELKKAELSYTDIRAPFTGIVSERLVEPGDVLPMHQHIVSLIDTSSLKIEVNISELLLPVIEAGYMVDIKIDALGDQHFTGEITRIYPAIDKNTRRGTIEIMLKPVPEGARPGQLSRVTIHTKSKSRLMIDYDAVRYDKQGSYVYLVHNNQAIRTAITPGLQLGKQIEILDGLKAEQRIVSNGFFGLKDRAQIKDVNSDTPATGKTP